MIFLGEPIGTWISIVAMLISISSVFIALRKQKLEEKKQKHEERIALAEKVEKIKTISGETVDAVDTLLEKLDKLENKIYTDNREDEFKEMLLKSISNYRLQIESMKTKANDFYSKYGLIEPKVTDPVKLSVAISQNDFVNKGLEKMKTQLDELASKVEMSIRKNKTLKKPVENIDKPKRLSKKK